MDDNRLFTLKVSFLLLSAVRLVFFFPDFCVLLCLGVAILERNAVMDEWERKRRKEQLFFFAFTSFWTDNFKLRLVALVGKRSKSCGLHWHHFISKKRMETKQKKRGAIYKEVKERWGRERLQSTIYLI